MSRLKLIRDAAAVHAISVFTTAGQTLTTSADPQAHETLPDNTNPRAIIIFEEDDPERLDFKQERRRITGSVAIAMRDSTRETMNLRLEAIRDLIFADVAVLPGGVDGWFAESGVTISNPDDSVIYGTLTVTSEEVF